MVCIIDDREDVWKMAPNLVHVRPYHFFRGTADINAPPEARKTDDDDDQLTEGASVKTTSHNVRILRVPKRPRDISCTAESSQDSVSEVSSVVNSDKNASDNGTSVNNGDTAVTGQSSANNGNTAMTGQSSANNGDTAMTGQSSANNGDTAMTGQSSADGDSNEQTDVNATPSCSNLAPGEGAGETSASGNSNSDLVMASSDSAADHAAELHSDEKEQVTSDEDRDTAASNGTGDGSERVSAVAERTTQEVEEYEELVEWEDLDDYLVYLEDILRRIHTAYYELYDEMQLSDNSMNAAPDLKTIVPYVRRKVLKGARIVFSGVCPLGSDPTTCRIYRVAESLGAVVQSSIVTGDSANSGSEATTTHVVAARRGTEKVKAASRQKSAWIVNPDWVWTCGDRWEWVDERLYPLNDETSARFLSRDSPDPAAHPRKKDTVSKAKETMSDAAADNELGEYSLVTLSKEDLSGMDAEVEKILDEESDSEYEDNETSGNVIKENQLSGADDNEEDTDLRKQVLSSFGGGKRKYEESSDEDSLSGDFPKGWKNCSRKRRRASGDADKLVSAQENNGDGDDGNEYDVKSDDDSQSANLSSSESGDEDFKESVGSVDEEIAAAVEKELLS